MTSLPSLPKQGPIRVLAMLNQRVVAETVAFTLNHGLYETRQAPSITEALALLREWRPHIAVVDMDIGGDRIVAECRRPGVPPIPVLGLTRRGD